MRCSWPVYSALSSQRALTNTAPGYKGQSAWGELHDRAPSGAFHTLNVVSLLL